MANTFIMLIPSNSTGLNYGEFATIRMGVLSETSATGIKHLEAGDK